MIPLATVGELERHLQRVFDDQGRAEQALVLASGAVRAYCGWDLHLETTTFQVDGDGSQVLSLPTLHLIALDELRINGEVIGVTDARYPLWSRKGQLFRAAGWAANLSVEADVMHGYDPIPDLIKLVVLDLAGRQLSNPEGYSQKTVGVVSVTYAGSANESGLSALHSRLLDRYAL